MTLRRSPRQVRAAARDYSLMAVLSAVMFAPIYYLVIGSLKPSTEVLDGFGGFVPRDLTLANYRHVYESLSSEATGYFARFFLNSCLISLVIVGGGLIVNSMAGYALARLSWVGRDKAFQVVALLIIVPFEIVAIPLTNLLAPLRDTLIIQMIPFIANAFSIYIFYSFFLSVPKSLEEAGRIDGLGPFGVFVRIVVPNSRPVFATVAILTFLGSWGQLLWPLLTTSDPNVRPLPLEIGFFTEMHSTDWGQVFAFGTLLAIPVVAVFLAFQRNFIQSVAGSAIKG